MFPTSDFIWEAILNGVANGHIDDPIKMARDLLEVRRLLDGEVTSSQQPPSSTHQPSSQAVDPLEGAYQAPDQTEDPSQMQEFPRNHSRSVAHILAGLARLELEEANRVSEKQS